MTIGIREYFEGQANPRKKEPQYVAFINKNSCTSCNACATMCPVDCIYEISGGPSDAYHVIDTSRCIGCQMCYLVPSESKGPWTMEICPWNAIDLIHNPNVKEWESLWEPYFAGEGEPPNFRKLEEIGYQLYLNRMIYINKGGPIESQHEPFIEQQWSYGEGDFAICRFSESCEQYDIYVTTEKGEELVDFLYREYDHMFLD